MLDPPTIEKVATIHRVTLPAWCKPGTSMSPSAAHQFGKELMATAVEAGRRDEEERHGIDPIGDKQ